MYSRRSATLSWKNMSIWKHNFIVHTLWGPGLSWIRLTFQRLVLFWLVSKKPHMLPVIQDHYGSTFAVKAFIAAESFYLTCLMRNLRQWQAPVKRGVFRGPSHDIWDQASKFLLVEYLTPHIFWSASSQGKVITYLWQMMSRKGIFIRTAPLLARIRLHTMAPHFHNFMK